MSEVIALRAVEADDTKLYHRWINDPETSFFRGFYPPASMAQAAEWVGANSETAADKVTYTITAGSSQAAGFIGLRGICARSRRAEIWIYIGEKSLWGSGIGRRAIQLLVTESFEQRNLHRLWLEAAHDNIRAIRCYEAVGFSLEGRLKDGYFRHGQYHDTVMMGLIRKKL